MNQMSYDQASLRELLIRWEEGDLTPAETEALVRILQENKFARRDLVFHFLLNVGIARILKAGKGAKAIAFQPPSKRPFVWVRRLALAASLVIVAGGVWFGLQPTGVSEPLGLRVTEATGEVQVVRVQGSLVIGHSSVGESGRAAGVTASPSHQVTKAGDGRNPQPATPCELRVGDMLRQGDRVVVGKDGKVGLKYDGEATTIEMLAATEAAFGAEKGAKRVRLDGGKFVCSAAPQKMAFEIRTRHATARVVGTRFSLDVTAPRTVLAVMEGKVDLIQGEKVLEVEAGASATVTDQGMEMTPTVTQTTAPMRSGCVWAWGRNQYGQLGDGTTVNKSTPVQVAGLSGVTAVAAGNHHTVALKSDGSVWAWGNNRSGQLGDGTRTDHQTPVPVKTADGTPLRGVAAIAAGAYNTVALKSDGRVLVWGDRLVERAGLIHSGPNELPGSVQLNGITAIAAGVCHMLALRSDDTVWTWGLNDHGQLGDGTKTARIAPVQVKLPDGTPLNGVIAIAAGGDGSMALRDDGTVWTWGIFGWSMTPFGQLVNGTETLTPVQVKLANGSPLSGIIAVTAGQEHAVALKNDGTVWAWGGNRPGQLGDGTKTYSRTPVQVKLPNGAPLSGVSAIAAGGCETTALLNDRTVWEWGSLGLGEPRLVPVQVKMADGSPLSGVITMASSDGHTVVVGE